MGSPTAFWTLSLCEWTATGVPSHSDDSVCSLSDVLETGEVPQRYFLSARACAGILRRAEARGRALPPHLLAALKAVAEAGTLAGDRKTT
jgi:DNA polymerase III epsilon subunit-like protein